MADPHISHMINRIGERKSKVFGVMDMTAGYHQAPENPFEISLVKEVFTESLLKKIQLS